MKRKIGTNVKNGKDFPTNPSMQFKAEIIRSTQQACAFGTVWNYARNVGLQKTHIVYNNLSSLPSLVSRSTSKLCGNAFFLRGILFKKSFHSSSFHRRFLESFQ